MHTSIIRCLPFNHTLGEVYEQTIKELTALFLLSGKITFHWLCGFSWENGPSTLKLNFFGVYHFWSFTSERTGSI